jgi:hypothetical protein
MDTADIKQQVSIFEKARNNLLAVIAFTVINLALTAFDTGVSFLFSATLPQFVFEVCRTWDTMIIGLVLAFIIIIPYFIFWLLAKRTRVLILVALIFFGIDSLVLLLLLLDVGLSTDFQGFQFSYLLELAFHGWILYYLVNGVRAWVKLRSIDTNVFNAVLQETKSKNPIPIEPDKSDEP